jgi:hypothetical protein
MKRFSFLSAMLAIVLAFGLAFVSCDNDTTSSGNTPGGNNSNPFVGTWVGTYQQWDITLTINQDNTFSMTGVPGGAVSGTYTVNGNTMTLTVLVNPPTDGSPNPSTGTLSGNNLVWQGITLTKQG